MSNKQTVIEQSHIQALTALVQAHDRISPLDQPAEAWRHEAYKLSIQKKAIEDEAVQQVTQANERLKQFRSAASVHIEAAVERELNNMFHKISCALMRTEMRIERLQGKIEDRKFIDQRRIDLTRHENSELRRLVANKEQPAEETKGEIGSLLAELKALEAEARRLDLRK